MLKIVLVPSLYLHYSFYQDLFTLDTDDYSMPRQNNIQDVEKKVELREKRSSKAFRALKNFSAATTLHGWAYLGCGQTGLPEKIFWLGAIVASFVVCGIMLQG
jgi:hypothetical protein